MPHAARGTISTSQHQLTFIAGHGLCSCGWSIDLRTFDIDTAHRAWAEHKEAAMIPTLFDPR